MIAGCDGFHGVCRPTVEDRLTIYEREYPFAWLGILAHAAPSSEELIYSPLTTAASRCTRCARTR